MDIQLLGAPVGNRLFVYQALASKCQEVVDECQLTARFTSTQLQLLLVQKSTVHRLTHLLRTIPMEEDHELSLGPPLHSVDRALRKVVDNSAFYPVSDRGWELAQRSLAVGGLGLAGPLDRADEAFVASFAHTVHFVQQHFPQFREMFPNFANPASPLQPDTQAHRALSALTRLTALAGNDLHKGLVSIAISRGDTLRLQKKLTAISESARVSRLSEYQGCSDAVRNEAMRQSCSGAALWPSTIPYQHTPHTALSNRDWRSGISRRLCQIIHHNHEDLVCPACKARYRTATATTCCTASERAADSAPPCGTTALSGNSHTAYGLLVGRTNASLKT